MFYKEILLSIAFLPFAYAHAANDFLQGIEAFENGDFLKAKNLLLTLANEGNFIAQGYINYLRETHNQKVNITSEEITYPKVKKRTYIYSALTWVEASKAFRHIKTEKNAKSFENELEKLAKDSSHANYLLGKLAQNSKMIDKAKKYFKTTYEMGNYLGAIGLVRLGDNTPEIQLIHKYVTEIAAQYPDAKKYEKLFDYFVKKNDRKNAKAFGRMGAYLGNSDLQIKLLNGFICNNDEAIFWVESAANRGNCDALTSLGHWVEYGKMGQEKDPMKAFQLYYKAAEHPKATGIALYNLGMCYEKGIGVDVSEDKALYYFKNAYEKGDLVSAGAIGRILLSRNDAKCFEYLQRAHEAGNINATQNLCLALVNKSFSFYNPQEALKIIRLKKLGKYENEDYFVLYNILSQISSVGTQEEWIGIENCFKKIACDKNSLLYQKAIISLMSLYFKDLPHRNKNYHLSREYADKGIAFNNVDAYFYRGQMHEFGFGQEVNLLGAFQCYQKASELGHAFVWNNLGSLYEKGFEGFSPNYEKARECYEKALANDYNGYVHYNYAQMLRREYGGLVFDEARYIDLLNKSAQLGDPEAWHSLGCYYLEIDDDKAFHYFHLATKAGCEPSQFILLLDKLVHSTDNNEIIKLINEIKKLADKEKYPMILENYALLCLGGFNDIFPRNIDEAIKYFSLVKEKGSKLAKILYEFIIKNRELLEYSENKDDVELKKVEDQNIILTPDSQELLTESINQIDESPSDSDEELDEGWKKYVVDYKKLHEEKQKEKAKTNTKAPTQEQKELNTTHSKTLKKFSILLNKKTPSQIRTQVVLSMMSNLVKEEGGSMSHSGKGYKIKVGDYKLDIHLNHNSGKGTTQMTPGRIIMVKDFATEILQAQDK